MGIIVISKNNSDITRKHTHTHTRTDKYATHTHTACAYRHTHSNFSHTQHTKSMIILTTRGARRALTPCAISWQAGLKFTVVIIVLGKGRQF